MPHRPCDQRSYFILSRDRAQRLPNSRKRRSRLEVPKSQSSFPRLTSAITSLRWFEPHAGLATYLNEVTGTRYLAALGGITVGAVWNYAVTKRLTWSRSQP
jgi:hypothetical protein